MADPARAYSIPRGCHRLTETIRASRFIASIDHIASVAQAKTWIARIRTEFTDATHNCWAYNAGKPGDTILIGSSDDGEPRGTAGRPMLQAVLHAGLGEVAVVVTRYFGGTKLGTGGLVRAYGGMAGKVLKSVPRIEKIHWQQVTFVMPYRDVATVQHIASQMGARSTREVFTRQVRLCFEVAADKQAAFCRKVTGATQGRGRYEAASSS